MVLGAGAAVMVLGTAEAAFMAVLGTSDLPGGATAP